jgi:pyruvate/2-oxoglutarate dehydrogenase complex dihydrolipoamide acyltransferase (E2) component
VTNAEDNESIAIRPMVNLILGWDHRALDGIYAAQLRLSDRRRASTHGLSVGLVLNTTTHDGGVDAK